MKMLFFHQITDDRKIDRSDFPFCFRRQTPSGPTSVGIGLEVAHVTDRFGRIDFAQARQGEREPLAIPFLPIERRTPFLLVDCKPAPCEPEFRTFVTAVFHECEILSICDEARSELKIVEEDPMAWSFIVEREIFALVSNRINAFGKTDPAQRHWSVTIAWDLDRGGTLASAFRPFHVLRCRINGTKRVLRKHVLDVCEEQLLMLLFVIQAERHYECQFAPTVFGPALKEVHHGGVNLLPILMRFFDGGS